MCRRRKVHRRKIVPRHENTENRRINQTEDKSREERKRIHHDKRMTTRHSRNIITIEKKHIEGKAAQTTN
jgi:hypothetical protein